MALLVALDSPIDQTLSDIRQEETPINELTLIEISLDWHQKRMNIHIYVLQK